jgi:hypothetical protein
MMLIILKTLVLILSLILFLLLLLRSTSKNGNSDGMIAFRAQSSEWGKGTLMPATTLFDACQLLISNKKRNRQEIKENEERRRK